MTELQRRLNARVFPRALYFVTTRFQIVIWNPKLTCLPALSYTKIPVLWVRSAFWGRSQSLMYLALILQGNKKQGSSFCSLLIIC